MRWFQQALTPRATDETLRRQGFLVIIVSVALALLALILVANSLLSDGFSLTIGISLFGALIYCVCPVLAKNGFVRPAAFIVTWLPALVIMTAIVAEPNSVTVYFLSIPILLSSIILSSLQILPIMLVGLLSALVAASRGDASGGSY